MTNKECKVRPKIINVNSDEPVFYPFSTEISKCRTSETRHIKWDEICKCKYRLNANVCNNKQHWIMINVDVNVKN